MLSEYMVSNPRDKSPRTGTETSVSPEHLYVRLDLRGLVPVEERWRRRLTLVLPCDGVEHDREILVSEYRTTDISMRDSVLRARLQIISIEALVWEFEDRLVRAEIFNQLDDPETEPTSARCTDDIKHAAETLTTRRAPDSHHTLGASSAARCSSSPDQARVPPPNVRWGRAASGHPRA